MHLKELEKLPYLGVLNLYVKVNRRVSAILT